MRTGILFVSLLLIILTGSDTVYASSYHKSSCSVSTQKTGKTHQLDKYVVDYWQQTSIGNNSMAEEDRYLVCEEEEDEDSDNQSAKKDTPSAHFNLGSGFHSILLQHNVSKIRASFWCQASCKYIVQRALRI